ncbi:hypothetical protein WMY93_031630 [Mugilogobius chulae]|uniref:RING-type domain-containing protein n=1 Tax=Mugilogobius chulae TaxID=88201 RepID=A0AAW0MHD5_9GOBI
MDRNKSCSGFTPGLQSLDRSGTVRVSPERGLGLVWIGSGSVWVQTLTRIMQRTTSLRHFRYSENKGHTNCPNRPDQSDFYSEAVKPESHGALQYTDPDLVQEDLKQVRSVFSDLRLYCDVYCFPNKEKRKLVFLAGTIPVFYQEAQYNFPLCLWLHHTHPAARPRCCVCPSVSMAINPNCRYVDAHGNILLSRLHTWTQGKSSLVLLVSEMKRVFEKDTPLYSRPLPTPQAPPPADGDKPLPPPRAPPPEPEGQKEAEKTSYCNAHTDSVDQLRMSDLSLHPPRGPDSSQPQLRGPDSSQPQLRQKHPVVVGVSREEQKEVSDLPPHKLQMFLQLLQSQRGRGQGAEGRGYSAEGRGQGAEGRGYSTAELLEAVRLNDDLSSAQRFLNHQCPVCQEQVSFSKMVLMTHCCCSLCESCFKSWFSSAIREKNVEQFVCPLCGKPDFRDQPDLDMDYFNLLDTQIKHFLSKELHELFQRKLRDRALIHMKHFCWCSHCSFGVVHESGSLKMDCPSCHKSTCSNCRSPWSPEHQGVSCEDFRVQTKTKTGTRTGPAFNCIECPDCGELFSGSRGGCLHFSCLRCGTEFCGGCSGRFVQGKVNINKACSFAASCSSKGLHAHHPRDCVYHLRDWDLPRLHLLLQGRVQSLRSKVSVKNPVGKPAPPGVYQGYCR